MKYLSVAASMIQRVTFYDAIIYGLIIVISIHKAVHEP